MEPLQVCIYTPGRLDNQSRQQCLAKLLKKCPSCGSNLVLLFDKFGEVSHDNSADSAVMAGSPGDGTTEKTTGGWYCSNCGLHIMPSKGDLQSLPSRESSPQGYNTNNSNRYSPSQLEEAMEIQAKAERMFREVQGLQSTIKEQISRRRDHLNQCKEQIDHLSQCHSVLSIQMASLDRLESQLSESSSRAPIASGVNFCTHCSKVRRTDSSTQTSTDKPWHSLRLSPVHTILPSKAVVNPKGSDHAHKDVVIPKTATSTQAKTPESRDEHRPSSQERKVRKRPTPLIFPARSYEILNTSHSPLEEFIAQRMGNQIPEPMSPIKEPHSHGHGTKSNPPNARHQHPTDNTPPKIPPRNYGPFTKDRSPPRSHEREISQMRERYLNNLRSHSEERQLDPRRRPLHIRSQSEERVLESRFGQLPENSVSQGYNLSAQETRDSFERSLEFMSEGEHRITSTPKTHPSGKYPQQRAAPQGQQHAMPAPQDARPRQNFDRADYGRFSVRDPQRSPHHSSTEQRSRSSERAPQPYPRSRSGGDLLDTNPYVMKWSSGNDDKLEVTSVEKVKSGERGVPQSQGRGQGRALSPDGRPIGKISERRPEKPPRMRADQRRDDMYKQHNAHQMNGFHSSQGSKMPDSGISRKDGPSSHSSSSRDNSPGKSHDMRNGYPENKPHQSQVSNGPIRAWENRSHPEHAQSVSDKRSDTYNATRATADHDTSSEAGFTSSLFPKPKVFHGTSEPAHATHMKSVAMQRSRLWEKPQIKSPS